LGLFGASRREKEEEAAALARRRAQAAERAAWADAESDAQQIAEEDKGRFKVEWESWLNSVTQAQTESDESEWTSSILSLAGTLPLPNYAGLTVAAKHGYGAFVNTYTDHILSARLANAVVAGGHQQAFWQRVQDYVKANLHIARLA
jgi:hypothetical protein